MSRQARKIYALILFGAFLSLPFGIVAGRGIEHFHACGG